VLTRGPFGSRDALDELSVEQRAMLSLHDLEELGVERIAEILAIPVGTVKSRLHHSRAALREKTWTLQRNDRGGVDGRMRRPGRESSGGCPSGSR